MVLIFPGFWWGWTPSLRLFGFSEDPLSHIGVFVMPGVPGRRDGLDAALHV